MTSTLVFAQFDGNIGPYQSVTKFSSVLDRDDAILDSMQDYRAGKHIDGDMQRRDGLIAAGAGVSFRSLWRTSQAPG